MKRTVNLTLDWKWASAIIVVAFIAVGGIAVANRNNEILPESIRKDITFSPLLVPQNSKSFSATSYHLSKAEDDTQVLSYIVTTDNNTEVTVSQYTQPTQFTDVADFKQQFLTNVAQQYDSVQTSNGTIYLGKQAKNNNHQLGVIVEKGLLVFLNPNKDLGKNDWRNLGEQLVLQKVTN